MAMASGVKAAEAILANREKRRYDAGSLAVYEKLLGKCFVLDDMKNCRDFLDIMHMHKELINDYPHVIKDALLRYFEVGNTPKRVLKQKVFRELKGRISMVKITQAFTSMMKGGI